jgi:hypothetical protein
LDQLQQVSGELLGLSSSVDVDLVDALLERVVAEVQPVVLKSVTSGSGCGVRAREGGVFPVVVAVLLLLVLAGGLRFGAGPKAGQEEVAAVFERPLPGLLTLTMAAVESEESLDLLLDRFADPGVLEPLGRPTFVQESL